MRKLSRHLHGADLGDAAHVVAAEVEQHQVLGALLGIGQQLDLQRGFVLLRRDAARRVPASGRMVTSPSFAAAPGSRAGADRGEAAEVEDRRGRAPG
jgi:hypothetical protein